MFGWSSRSIAALGFAFGLAGPAEAQTTAPKSPSPIPSYYSGPGANPNGNTFSVVPGISFYGNIFQGVRVRQLSTLEASQMLNDQFRGVSALPYLNSGYGGLGAPYSGYNLSTFPGFDPYGPYPGLPWYNHAAVAYPSMDGMGTPPMTPSLTSVAPVPAASPTSMTRRPAPSVAKNSATKAKSKAIEEKARARRPTREEDARSRQFLNDQMAKYTQGSPGASPPASKP